MRQDRVRRVEHHQSAAFRVGDTLDDHRAVMLETCDVAATGEHRDRRAGAVGDGDLERMDARSRCNARARDLTTDPCWDSRDQVGHRRQPEPGEPFLQPLVVELLDGGPQPLGQVAKAHVGDASHHARP